MRTIFENFCRLNALNVEPAILFAMGAIYVILLITTIGGIYTKNKWTKHRLLWMVIVIVFPFAGIAVYCLFSLLYADYSAMKQFGFGMKNKSGRGGLKNA